MTTRPSRRAGPATSEHVSIIRSSSAPYGLICALARRSPTAAGHMQIRRIGRWRYAPSAVEMSMKITHLSGISVRWFYCRTVTCSVQASDTARLSSELVDAVNVPVLVTVMVAACEPSGLVASAVTFAAPAGSMTSDDQPLG
jgi:hypothetical protein